MSDSYNYSATVGVAKNIKTNVEKKKVLGENAQWSYFIAKQIVSPKKDVIKKYINSAPQSTGSVKSTKIMKKDYLDMASRLIKYVDNNKTLPNFISYGTNKINVNDYTYMFARILVYYDANKNTYPNYAIVDSASFNKTTTTTTTTSNGLKPYMTNRGCAGMGQCTGYYCGCNSLQQCFYRLTGIQVAESTIAGWAGTTTSGTGHAGLESAVAKFNKTYNKNIKITWKNFSDLGSSESARWKKLQEYIDKGAVFCHLLYRNKYGHYEVPKQVLGDNVIVLNSLGDKCTSTTYCGYIETRTKSTQRSYINGISQKSIAILTKG